MTYEEAIIHFKEQLEVFGGEHHEAMKVAISAIEKHIPKEPVNKYEDDIFVCPICNSMLMNGYRCIICGQAIDWSEQYDR